MIFNLLCFLFIILITLYMATQGLLSSLIALVTAVFSSILAMGMVESLQSIIGSWRPDYARGITLLALFFIIFCATRVTADILVPKDIKLPYLINRLAGGFVGFFTGMVVIGTIILGLEMLPLRTSIMGYDRFPLDSRMQGDVAGVAANNYNTWLAPERLTLALWNGAAGRSLGDFGHPWSDVHPDINVESYGYRNTVLYASNHTLPPDLFDVTAAWASLESKDFPKDDAGKSVIEPGKKMVMIRTVVKRGKSERDSADPGAGTDAYFRVTPTQVRLVTDKHHQYYPIGYLERGTQFVKTPLDTGHLVDDFVKGNVIEDWVFQIGDDENPKLIEVKELARKDITALVKEKPVPALASGDYPQKPYQKDRGNIIVNVNLRGQALADGNAYVLREVVPAYKDISNAFSASYRHMVEAEEKMAEGTSPPWNANGSPGVPPRMNWYGLQSSIGITIMNQDPNAPAQLERAIPIMLFGPIEAEGSRNAARESDYITSTLIPLFKNVSSGSLVLTSAPVGKNGKVELQNIGKGKHLVFVYVRTDKNNFYFWLKPIDVSPKGTPDVDLDVTGSGTPKIEM